MMDIEELLSPYGPGKPQGGGGSTPETHPEIAPATTETNLEQGLVDLSAEPTALPAVNSGKHRAEVPTDSVKPTAQVVPIQIGRLSA